MTQKEFEERTGLKLSADGYTEVEECYMNTDLDKDAFCKLWMENPTALKEIERKTVLVRELYEERKCLTNLLIDQAEKWSASDLREKAIAMIGEKEYLRRKIAKGYNYSPMNEYTYIIFDHKGKRLGKIEFGKRISVPSASEIEEAIKDGFPNGATYKLIVPINVCISQ